MKQMSTLHPYFRSGFTRVKRKPFVKHTCGKKDVVIKLKNGQERRESAFHERYFFPDPNCTRCLERQREIDDQQRFDAR